MPVDRKRERGREKMNPKKLKRAVVKEELVAICGDFIDAIILNQFIYWTDRVKNYDKYIAEEIERAKHNGIEKIMSPCNGWIYKNAEELADETMIAMSASSMRRHIKKLIALGYLDERHNPEYKWDQTKQYRVNLNNVQIDLVEQGYTLDGYATSKIENATSKIENGDSKIEIQNHENERAIPETTTEITEEEEEQVEKFPKKYIEMALKVGATKLDLAVALGKMDLEPDIKSPVAWLQKALENEVINRELARRPKNKRDPKPSPSTRTAKQPKTDPNKYEKFYL